MSGGLGVKTESRVADSRRMFWCERDLRLAYYDSAFRITDRRKRKAPSLKDAALNLLSIALKLIAWRFRYPPAGNYFVNLSI
jgi:hypothetical protein